MTPLPTFIFISANALLISLLPYFKMFLIGSFIKLDYFFIFQDQWNQDIDGSSPQLSGSSAAPWILAPALVQLLWATAGRRAGTRLQSSGGWVCRLWEAASALSPGSPHWSERKVGSNTHSPCWVSVALFLTSTHKWRSRKLCVPWQSSVHSVNGTLETWWWKMIKEHWTAWGTLGCQLECSENHLPLDKLLFITGANNVFLCVTFQWNQSKYTLMIRLFRILFASVKKLKCGEQVVWNHGKQTCVLSQLCCPRETGKKHTSLHVNAEK